MRASLEAITAIKEKGQQFDQKAEAEGYSLTIIPNDESAMLIDASTISQSFSLVSADARSLAEAAAKADEPKENIVLACIDVMGRVSFFLA